MDTIIINNELNDDWIRQLSNYKKERGLYEELRKKRVKSKKNSKNAKKTKKKVLKFVKK